MLLPGMAIRFLGLALVLGLAPLPSVIGQQDVGAIVGHPVSWRAYLVAAPREEAAAEPSAADGFDALSDIRPAPQPLLGTTFVLAEAAPAPPALQVAQRPPPFIDRTARSDRLPVLSGDMTPSMLAGMVTPLAIHGMAARSETTPDELELASATPDSADEPVVVAALPVEEPPPPPPKATYRLASLPAGDDSPEGVTSAARGDDEKGQSTTRLSHVLLLPERDLQAQQKCLAEAVYFEARGEPLRGQYAVAQVVMNRTRSGFYPNKICKVVYQNRHMFNACQFSFACDRWPDRVYSRSAWNVAMKIAKDVTENGAWLPEVGGATHYHADYIRAWWASRMIRITKIGRHIFYRPRWLPDLGREPAVSQVRQAPLPAQDS